MAKLLIVEDEAKMRTGLVDNLTAEGYEVAAAGDGDSGLRMLMTAAYDLAILDVMLPGQSGFDILRKCRAAGVKTPVIMLTAKGEEIDKVLGLELGADDYCTKPFGLRELFARIKAVLRRHEEQPRMPAGSKVVIGRLTVDFHAYTAAQGGRAVEMTPKEIDVLRYLYDHRDGVVSRDQLLEDVWESGEYVTSRTVDNFILRLRQKIEQNPANPRIILTIHGSGYKFVGSADRDN
jgi:DNA-binding response OmpR family regulator